jgi:hypothetical protein
VITLDSIQDERFIRLGNLRIGESVLVRKVEVGGNGVERKSWRLYVHLHVDCFVWLDTEDDLVSHKIRKDTLGGILELYTDLDLGLVEGCVVSGVTQNRRGLPLTFTSLHDEWDALPSGVVHPECQCGERWAGGAFGHSVVVQVPRLVVRSHVLTKKNVFTRNRGNAPENFDLMYVSSHRTSRGQASVRYLFVTDVFRRE